MAVELTQEQSQSTTDLLRGNDTEVHGHRDTEYELDQSESLTFLYNLLYDDNSYLSKSDILDILNSLKLREESLPFSFHDQNLSRFSDVQGVYWSNGLRDKFYSDRRRIGSGNWFHNIPNSLQLGRSVCKNDIIVSLLSQ